MLLNILPKVKLLENLFLFHGYTNVSINVNILINKK